MILKRKLIVSILVSLLVSSKLIALEHTPDSLPAYGVMQKSSAFFQNTYHNNDLVHYLDNLDLYSTYQTETTGQYNLPDQLVFSLEGNSHRWNSYYVNGFRVDSRFFAGSTLFQSDLYRQDLSIDYIGSNLYFDPTDAPDDVSISFNTGGLSNISAGTKWFINLFHASASERLYKPIEHRNKMQGAGTARVNFSIKGKEDTYKQSIYVDFGQRQQVFFDQEGINAYEPEYFGKIQMHGELPLTLGGLFDKTHYLLNYAGRENLYSEFYYGLDETAEHHAYSASFYGQKKGKRTQYTSGLTFAAHTTEHDNINFSRNIIDQDGEAFNPFYQDGVNYELSHALNLNHRLTSWLDLTFDSYNSFMYTQPSVNTFHNYIYAQQLLQPDPTPLFVYEWEANSFASGLLENALGLAAEKRLHKSVNFKANLNVTLDAMLLSKKSMLRPNFEVQAGFDIRPCKWFNMELTLGTKRVSYTIEDIRFLSDDYMNGTIYYMNDKNGDGLYQEGERGDFFGTTGGKYHTTAKGLRQPGYLFVDIPVNFTVGRHTFTFLQSFRKHYNVWRTRYDKDYSEYGYMTLRPPHDGYGECNEVFFHHGGKELNYVVDYYPEGSMGNNFFTSSPYYLSSNMQYKYTGKKFMFSLAWQSYMMAGLSSMGNGVLHNNLGTLSEGSANPNSLQTASNQNSEYKASGRLDQDKAYILRIMASYNITRNFMISASMKFKDGQAFSIFHTYEQVDPNGNKQVAIYPHSTRGINTFDGNFGTREDAFFNIDLRATYRCLIADRQFEAQLACYNLYDFGTELTEYVFDQNIEDKRRAMSLNIPRGFILSLKYEI